MITRTVETLDDVASVLDELLDDELHVLADKIKYRTLDVLKSATAQRLSNVLAKRRRDAAAKHRGGSPDAKTETP